MPSVEEASAQATGWPRAKRILLQLFWNLAASPRELAFDLRYHVRTWRGIRLLPHAQQSSEALAHARAYEGTDATEMATLLGHLPDDLSRFAFIDLGCGTGKALLIAWGHGFRKLVGVELAPNLAGIARRNVLRYRGPRGSGQIEITEADAREVRFPGDPLVVFLYDPFDGTVMRDVVERLTESLRSSPRPAYVLYHIPLERSYWDASPLTVLDESESNVIYAFDPARRRSSADLKTRA